MIEPLANALGVSVQELLKGEHGVDNWSVSPIISFAATKENKIKRKYSFLILTVIIAAIIIIMTNPKPKDSIVFRHGLTKDSFRTCAVIRQYSDYSFLDIIIFKQEAVSEIEQTKYWNLKQNQYVKDNNQFDTSWRGMLMFNINTEEIRVLNELPASEIVEEKTEKLNSLWENNEIDSEEFMRQYSEEILEGHPHPFTLLTSNMCKVSEEIGSISMISMPFDSRTINMDELMKALEGLEIPIITRFSSFDSDWANPVIVSSHPSIITTIEEVIIIDYRD